VHRFSGQRKYDLTVAALPRDRYRRGFEPGCATGSLTARLADRVDELVAWDRNARAVAATSARCSDLSNVWAEEGRLPDWPAGTMDLVVFSEILCYFDPDTIERILNDAADRLEPDGHLVGCHYRPRVPQHAVVGDEVHRLIHAGPWQAVVQHREVDFVLEVFERS
jgi:SAM-dependent methyltransferase